MNCLRPKMYNDADCVRRQRLNRFALERLPRSDEGSNGHLGQGEQISPLQLGLTDSPQRLAERLATAHCRLAF